MAAPGSTDLLSSWEVEHCPDATEKGGPTGFPPEGFLQRFMVPLGPPLLVDGATYKQCVYVAPCDGCYLKEIWTGSLIAPMGGTNTIAISAIDKGGGSARNQLSAATLDPTLFFKAAAGAAGSVLTLSTTYTDRILDEGDLMICTLVVGTESINGEGLLLGVTMIEPAQM